MKMCTSCGEARNPDDARFCASCGTSMIDGTAPRDEPAADEEEPFDPAPLDPAPPLAVTAGAYDEPFPAAVGDQPDQPNREARYWAIAAHVSALAGGFMGGLPAFLGPLIIWLVRKDEDAWSAGHGRDALNFNLSVLLYAAALLLLAIVTLGVGLLIAVPGWIALALGWFALTIVGAIKAASDQTFRYPLSIRFVK
jgi:uncharacterized Tic20 family protein